MHLIILGALALATLLVRPGPIKQVPEAKDSELAFMINEFSEDQDLVYRTYAVRESPTRAQHIRDLCKQYLGMLAKTDFDRLSQEGKVDYVLLRSYIDKTIHNLDDQAAEQNQIAPLLPFAPQIIALEESRERMDPVDPQAAAKTLAAIADSLPKLTDKLGKTVKADRYQAYRAAREVDSLRQTLKGWFDYYNGYDPNFSWWVPEPQGAADKALESYGNALREKLVGIKPDDKNAIVGNPIGREALIHQLQDSFIPYTPEELIDVAQKQYDWCLVQMKQASREMGFGDDWKKALEKVKESHVEPGQQPALIRKLALEAEKFIQDRNLVTVPQLALDSWHMRMMSPEQQLVSPFFLGGETIMVSFPTAGMTQEQKEMSMRANNEYFARATVFHELIPGHWLQQFMNARYHTYRDLFDTPFWIEGWALYWEMFMWDQGFDQTPEQRVGALFWRMHRCARIIFSLDFHLGKMTPEQCIDFLVDKVGHERASAEGEVRRSLNGDYPPLYQAAYMLGGLQIRAMHHELVDSGKMSNRQFHDAFLHENEMPIELLRALLEDLPLTRDYQTAWRFPADPPSVPITAKIPRAK